MQLTYLVKIAKKMNHTSSRHDEVNWF